MPCHLCLPSCPCPEHLVRDAQPSPSGLDPALARKIAYRTDPLGDLLGDDATSDPAAAHALLAEYEGREEDIPEDAPVASATIWHKMGDGTPHTAMSAVDAHTLLDWCIRHNRPITFGHVFGNLDGTHPRR